MKTKSSIIILFAAISLLGISSCKKSQPAPSYIVEGATDPSMNGKMAYLLDYNTGNRLDSVMVDSNKFVFSGTVDSVRYCVALIEVDGIARERADLILDTGRIVVNLKDQTATGGPLNAALVSYVKERDNMRMEYTNIYKELEGKIKDENQRRKEFERIHKNEWYPKYISMFEKNFEANTNNIVGAVILTDMADRYRTGQMDTAFTKLSKDILELKMVQEIVSRNESLKKTAVGQKFSDFTIEQPDGSKVSLSDYAGKGKYVLVDFWASWCGPCRGETPNLKELYNKYKGDKFEIVGVTVWDDVAESKKAIEEDKITWPQILDAQEIPMKLYGILGIPHIMLIGPDGTILARDLRGEGMKNKIAEVLNTK